MKDSKYKQICLSKYEYIQKNHAYQTLITQTKNMKYKTLSECACMCACSHACTFMYAFVHVCMCGHQKHDLQQHCSNFVVTHFTYLMIHRFKNADLKGPSVFPKTTSSIKWNLQSKEKWLMAKDDITFVLNSTVWYIQAIPNHWPNRFFYPRWSH